MILNKYYCIKDFVEHKNSCFYGEFYLVEVVDLKHIEREPIYRMYKEDNSYVTSLYERTSPYHQRPLFSEHFIKFGEWKALCRDKQINSILEDYFL